MRVDAARVEAELARMQRELTNSEVRASLFNLVVMSPDVQRTMVDESLNYLLGKRAARVIHIVETDEQESDLEVSARCFVDHEHKGVCFEEVVITNGRDGAGGAPGSWIPLLVRDIPTYVLWLDTVADKPTLFSHAQTQSDKIIVDADHCVELGDDPDTLLRTLSRVSVDEGVPVADFSWKRLRPHRRLTAAAFDDDRMELLDEIATVNITGMRPVAGRLFGLWLADRLGWSVLGPAGRGAASRSEGGVSYTRQTATAPSQEGNGTTPLRFRDVRGRDVRLVLDQGEPGCDISIAVTLTSGESVEITTALNGCADVDYPGGRSEEVVTLPSSGEILLEEVDAVYADDLYRDALSLLE